MNERILVIDDDRIMLETYLHMLVPKSEDENLQKAFDVVTANSGEEAIEKAKEAIELDEPFAAAFVDMVMPGLSGVETIKELRKLDDRIYTVIVTAYADEIIDDIYKILGYDIILLKKPISIDSIYHMAGSLCSNWNKNVELREYRKQLEESNTALRVLLKQKDEDQKRIEQRILLNVKKLIKPHLKQLKEDKLDHIQKASIVDIIESNIDDITSSFLIDLSTVYSNFTPLEIRVADFVKQGWPSKDIAKLLNLSPRTIEAYRQRLREKLGIKYKNANLTTILQSL